MTKRSLALPAEPQSVRAARTWVASVLAEIGRGDLVAAAETGVSELVTNALIHAEAPMTVRIRGTREHPRIEVVDHSPEPLHPTSIIVATTGDLPATFGRGLTMVAMNSAQWGSDRDADGGSKTVWFEPTDDLKEEVDITDIFRSLEDVQDEAPEPAEDSILVRLQHLPAGMFARLRQHHLELRREMRLLAFADPERYPLAVAITDLFRVADRERRATQGVPRLDEAIRKGIRHVDLDYRVPVHAPQTMARALDLLSECYSTFGDDELLAMTPDAALVELQKWYFGEFVRQGRGEPPDPWQGREPAPVSRLASSSVG